MREGHSAYVSALLLSKNGQTLFSADQSGAVVGWHLIDGEQVTLSGGTGSIVKLTTHVYMHGNAAQSALVATGMQTRFKITEGTDLLAGVSDDGSMCFWDLDRGVLRLRIPRAHNDAISSLCISAADMDGQGVTITASEDAVMRIWDTRPMMEIPVQAPQIDTDWAIFHLRKNDLFSHMSDGDLTVLLHSMQVREFEPLERIIWNPAEIESEDRQKQSAEEEVPKTVRSLIREKCTDVIVLVVSGIAIATIDEVVLGKFRPGDCLGGAGWNGFHGGGEYNGVAKSKCRCLVLHKRMYQLIIERDYGHILSTYLTDGLIESDWKDLTTRQRQGLGSILGVQDQQFLAQYNERLGLGGWFDFSVRTQTSMAGPSTSHLTSPRTKTSVSFAGGRVTPRENEQEVAESRPKSDVSSNGKDEMESSSVSGARQSSEQEVQQGLNLPTHDTPVPMTPLSAKKNPLDGASVDDVSEDAEVVEGNGGSFSAENSFPSPTLCAAAQLYRRKLIGGNTWRQLAELQGHSEAVTCLALDDRGRMFSGSRDKTLRLWDLRKLISQIREAHGSSTKCMYISSKLADQYTLTVIAPGEESKIDSHGHLSWVTDVAINNTSTLAVSTSYDSTIRLWSLKEGEIGHHIRTIKCAHELDSVRLESLCITDNAEFAFVCGPSGVFQAWRLTDGARLSGIDWGGMFDAFGELVGDRIEYKALSISRGASLVATCRNADIVLWESEKGNGILDLALPSTSERSPVRNAKTIMATRNAFLKAGKAHRDRQVDSSSKNAKVSSGREAATNPHHNEPRVPIPTGKIIRLPGTLEERRSEREEVSRNEYYALKLQVKDVVKDLTAEIRSEGSKLLAIRQADSPKQPKKSDTKETSPNRPPSDSPVRAGSPLQNADRSSFKPKRQKNGWTCCDQAAMKELEDGGVLADSDNANAPTLLMMHSEALMHGKYSWSVSVVSDCSLRVGITSSEAAGLPLESDVTEPNGENWSWYLEADRVQGMRLYRNYDQEWSQEEDIDFGRKGDVITITLDCRSGQLSFEVKRGAELFQCSFSPDSGLSRHPEVGIARASSSASAEQRAEKAAANGEAGQGPETDGSQSKVPSKATAAEKIDGPVKTDKSERRLYAFVELFGQQCDVVAISKITHESRIPARIRTFYRVLSESLQNSKVVRPIESSEISYKGGTVEINGRCGGSKNLEESASTVTITWPRTALPGPTKMEVRVCPPPANSDESCEARYTSGIDKLTSGRVVGLVVDIRPHGLEFHVPITIRIPHGLVMEGDEIWQNQMEGVKLDAWKNVMGVPNCLFTCIDGKFNSKYGLLTVKSSGVFGLKASSFCSDVVHAKIYCKPGPTLLEKRKSVAAHLRPAIDLKMHEVTPENYPEVFFDSPEVVPMSIKVCGVFCQNEEFKDVLKAPIYYLPYRTRIITMSIKEHGYALGVNLVLSPPVTKSSLMSFTRSSSDDDGNLDDLNMINMIYFGGPINLKFGLSARKGKEVSDLVLNHPSYHWQELKVSLKLRGNISSLLDQTSDAALKQLIKQKRLQQYISLMPFPVLVRKRPPKKHFQNALEDLFKMDSMSSILSGGLPKEGGCKNASASQLSGDSAIACDLFLIRNPSAGAKARLRETKVMYSKIIRMLSDCPLSGFHSRFCCVLCAKTLLQVLQFLEGHGWTFNDISLHILEGTEDVPDDDYLHVNNSKAVLVFTDVDMFKDHLPQQLPLMKMWVAALKAHGIDAQNRFGGDSIIIVSTGKMI